MGETVESHGKACGSREGGGSGIKPQPRVSGCRGGRRVLCGTGGQRKSRDASPGRPPWGWKVPQGWAVEVARAPGLLEHCSFIPSFICPLNDCHGGPAVCQTFFSALWISCQQNESRSQPSRGRGSPSFSGSSTNLLCDLGKIAVPLGAPQPPLIIPYVCRTLLT